MQARPSGFSLIELMVTVLIAGILFTLAIPAFQSMMTGTRIKAAAESIMSGLRQAKSEAIKRNMPMRFQLVSSLTSACAFSTSSPLWVVTQTDQLATGDASGNCDKASDDATDPIAFKSSGASYPKVTIDADASVVTFSPMGLVLTNMEGGASLTQVDVSSDVEDTTPWRVLVSSGGSIKLCNAGPDIAADSPLRCP